MYILLQRVANAAVTVGAQQIAMIRQGLLVFVGIEKNDDDKKLNRMLDRILGYRVFEDTQGQMNLSVQEVQGEILLVPQFTLAADTKKGMRPGFSSAKPPEEAQVLFDKVVKLARARYDRVESGQFGAHMAVALINDGPVTFLLHI